MSKVGTGVKKYILIPEAYPLHALARVFGPKTGPLSTPTPVPVPVIGELLRQTGKEKVTISEVVPRKVEKITGKILKFSEPVRLNLSNYTLPYDEIMGKKPVDPPSNIAKDSGEPESEIKPDIVDKPVNTDAPAIAEKKEEEKKAPEKPVEEKTIGEGNTVKSETIEVPVPTGPTSGNIAPVEEAVTTPAEVITTTTSAPAEPVEETPEEQVERAERPVVQAPDFTSNGVVDPWEGMTNEEREAYSKMSKQERKAARKAHRSNSAVEE